MKTRKLKDLRNDECVKVHTLKHADKLRNEIIGRPTSEELLKNYIVKDLHDGFLYWQTDPFDRNILPSSYFIKPKKPKKWKEAFKEIARLYSENEAMNEDIERLDKELIKLKLKNNPISVSMPNYGTKEFVSMLNSSTKPHSTDCRNLHVKDVEDVKVYKYFKAGYWYTDGSGWIVFLNEYRDDKASVYGFQSPTYGREFYHALLNKETFCYFNGSAIRLATNEEVESALIAEAEKRGFKEGVKLKRNYVEHIMYEGGRFVYDNNMLLWEDAEKFGIVLYQEGQWATIIEQPEEIDWSKPGQIVKGEFTTAITTGKHVNSHFQGFVINVTDGSDVNHLCSTLVKKCFSLVDGEITLKND